MGDSIDSWASIIRSCCLTSKTPLTPWEINRDTKMLEGRDIPFRQFGCSTLEEMLRKTSGITVFSQMGKTVVKVIPTEETAHISRMVRLQKSSKKKPRTLPPAYNKFSAYNRRPPTYRAPQNNRNVPQYRNNYNAQNRMPNQRPAPEPVKRPPMGSTPYASSYRTSTTPSAMGSTQSTPSYRVPTTPPATASTPSSAPSYRTPTTGSTPTSAASCRAPMTPPATPTSQPPPLMSTPVNPPQRIPPSTPQATTTSKSVHFVSTPPLSNIQQRLTPTPVSHQPQQQQQQQHHQQQGTPKPSLAQRLNVARTPPTLDDPRLTLNNYAEARKLPLPVYKDLPMKNHSIVSSVTINSKKYSSYPKEAKTKDEAEKLAAQAALDELLGKNRTPKKTTSDKNLLIKRVVETVNDHPNGLFESKLVESYTAQYNEGLPQDYLKLVESFIAIDIGANELTILSPLTETDNRTTSPSMLTEPEVLKLHGMEDFWLHIYVVYNTTDIWGVIIDENHSDKIEELAKQMKIFYDSKNSESTTVIPGKFYAVFDQEWHRVRCIKIDESGKTATVFFIDRGDEDVFPVSKFHVLQPEFCRLPAQSVRLSMAGLEIFADYSEVQLLMEEMLNEKDVFVKNLKFDQRFIESSMVSAQIHLVKDNEEVNANELLRSEIMTKLVDPMIYMATDKVAQQAYISYVSEKSIFVQLYSKGIKQLNTQMKELAKDCLNNIYYKRRSVLRFDPSKMYVTKNLNDGNWYRVQIVKVETDNQAQVLCIDVGNTLTVMRSNLVLLEDLSENLTLYPKQAVQIKLHKISPLMFDKRMADHLRKLAPKTDLFYMKVVDKLEGIPVVEFYKRTENNYLASLNDTLALEPEITSKDDNNNKPRMRNDRSSIGSRAEFPLKAPHIPSVGSYFDVHITMAAHPGNFTIQPLNSIQELEKLMVELSSVCETYTGPTLTSSCVKVGNMYAVKYDDDCRWYRAYVSKIISRNVCAVYFCDYGDYRAVSLEQLQPLQNQFHDLPYQAVKAKLAGVTPKLKGDWTVKDSLRFNELIVGKSFVSVIKSCDIENVSTGETILGLELIDTSTSEDIYITHVLVNEKRADKIEV